MVHPVTAPRVHVHPDTATVRVSASTSFTDLLTRIVPEGLLLPVLPGTRHLTVGGAVAADVHGKNQRSDGSLGRWITEIEILDGTGEVRRLTPGDNEITDLASFFHRLDALGGWNRTLGPRGFVEYQCVVPEGAHGVIGQILEAAQDGRVRGRRYRGRGQQAQRPHLRRDVPPAGAVAGRGLVARPGRGIPLRSGAAAGPAAGGRDIT